VFSSLTTTVTLLRMLVEVALFSLIGQGVLYVLAGANRERNIFYIILKTIASPAMRVARWVSPPFVVDQHIGWVALFLLTVLWLGLGVAKQIAIGIDAS
jgi:hypothetical protein